MSPIYNPIESTDLLNPTGYEYFKEIGLLTSDMNELIGSSADFPTPDEVTANNPTITNSVCKWISGNSDSAIAWDFPSTINTGLAITYVAQCTAYIRMEFSNDAASTSLPDHYYEAQIYGGGSIVKILKQNPTASYTTLGSDTTLFQANVASSPFFGLGLYVDGSGADTNVRLFLQTGNTQWLQLLNTTDSSGATEISEFNSFSLANYNNNSRNVTPLYVWGA